MAVLGEATEFKLLDQKYQKPYRLTPYIVTICEGTVSEIDIRNFMEAGLRIVRFKMTHVARKDKVVLLSALKKAAAWCRYKYPGSSWPIAACVDLPNACIRTGYLKEDINKSKIYLEEGKIVELTSEVKYWNQCDDKTIFIDDPYTLETVKVDTKISINFSEILLICIEVTNNISIKCKVIVSGYLSHAQFVCLRGVRHVRPTLNRLDKQLLAFVKEFQLDIVTVHTVRTAETLEKVRGFFKGSRIPLIVSAICEQEGLDNLDDIIQASDGIILGREFLAHSLVNPKQLIAIQLYVSGRCRMAGKPFYITGNILEETLKYGTISCSEVHDVTNAVLQGAGLVLGSYTDPNTLLTTMNLLDSVCRVAETVPHQDDFWRLCLKTEPPVTAADAAILACAITTKQSESTVIVVLTVTGKTAIQLSQVGLNAIILSVTTSTKAAKRLQLYRGIIPIIYEKKSSKDWHADMIARIQFAVFYGLSHDLLRYKQSYVILRKSDPTSAYCDQISVWDVIDEETKRKGLTCTDNHSELAIRGYGPLSTIW